jgi:transposase InsO family protein
MPWMEMSAMSQRAEFLSLARQQAVPFAELCRRFRISRKTGYKWVARGDCEERSRRPHASPLLTSAAISQRVIDMRQQHPAWGGRKIRRRLGDLGVADLPHPSTISHILRRAGLLVPATAGSGKAYHRFEHDSPNALWQSDFKGHFPMRQADRCHPLTALDDHSRYGLVLRALPDESRSGVQRAFERAFRTYGMPERINFDNGQPWGSPRTPDHGISQFTIWLARLGIRVSFSAPAHPQTNGKTERFHRTLKAELLAGRTFKNLAQAQREFDRWREVYNFERPHEAIGMEVPASRYRASPRSFPNKLPPIEYGPDDTVSTVRHHGFVRFAKQKWKVSKALEGLPIAFRPRGTDHAQFEVYFCHQKLGEIDLSKEPEDV